MNKKLFKSVALLASVAMLASVCLTGCSSDSDTSKASVPESSQKQKDSSSATPELKPATLKWLLRIPEQAQGADVLKKINERLNAEINATLDITFIDPAAYAEKTKLMISSSEVFDIMFTSAGYGYADYATKGAFAPLDALLTEYAPKTLEQIPEGFWGATKVNGKTYAIPNYQIAARQTTIDFRKEMVEKHDLDVANLKTYEDMEPLLKTLKEKEPKTQFILSPPGLIYFDTLNYMGIEGIGSDGSPGVIEINGADLKVFNQFEYPAFVKLVNTTKGYEKAGYINKDLALVTDTTELAKNGEILCKAMENWKPGIEAEMAARNGYESIYTKITEPYVNTTSILGTLQAVSRTSKNPERAMMLLELVNTDAEIYNTIVYGLEGKHYNVVAEGEIEKIADSGYNTNVPWMIGNTFNGYFLKGADHTIYEQTQKLNESSKVSRIMGFTFNPEPVKAEISQCATVNDKYIKGLQFGMYDDVEKALADYNKELKAAGSEKVIAEKQAQLDAWAATK